MMPNDADARDRTQAPPVNHRLWKAFARSVLFNLQAEIVANLIRVGGVIFLARELQPRDFGLLRILIVVGAIAALIGSGGFPEAIIQRKQLLSEHQTTAWWLTIACGGGDGCAAVCDRSVRRAVDGDGRPERHDPAAVRANLHRGHVSGTQRAVAASVALRRLGHRRPNR